ncbi:hypothetical protein GGTG_02137 [Gaeumannomyces tritici R3-111a-1]|uniref:Uncharacterized protein n=1 Tax=Gaeumannomyces tritici (strain R3-111a-1) TaxID=644352 RepID=J3NLI8_GAET3|nr:hypothetical protein GGTG_02137 [Gaeumannomyces tritici R3-111a-1]EJT82163.1 hypothetical protein GGTG_02137 [Gaeumannomyces tritici R3-111a-1]
MDDPMCLPTVYSSGYDPAVRGLFPLIDSDSAQAVNSGRRAGGRAGGLAIKAA